MRYLFFTLFIAFLVSSFAFQRKNNDKTVSNSEVLTTDSAVQTTDPMIEKSNEDNRSVNTEITPLALSFVEYAKTLTGTPYLYGSTDPAKGLDCSGFINVVSKHFGLKVPRSSVEFTNVGTTVVTEDAKPGDLVLFTGTDPNKRVVGHIGIITDNINGNLKFIHSSSGKAKGVTTSDLDGYYQTRFVKVVRIFPTAVDKVAV